MNRSLPLAVCILLVTAACNDDPVYFPFGTDTDPETDTGSGDTASDATEDTSTDVGESDTPEPDAEPDTPEPDVGGDVAETDAEPDAPEPDVEPDVEPDAPEPDVEPDVEPDTEPDVEPDTEPDVPDVCEPGTACDDTGICGFDVDGCGFDPVCILDCPVGDEVNVCGCEGTVARANPLCTDAEYAYVLDDTDQRAELEGADCDPTEFGRLRYSAVLSFSEMDFFVGGTLHIRVASNWDDSYVLEERILIESASFDFTVPNVLDTDLFGWFFEWYIDTDENGTCTFPDELSWSRFESNPFDAGPVYVAISGDDELDEFTCELWEGE